MSKKTTSYKKTTTKNLKVLGVLVGDTMKIDTGEEELSITTLLSDFDNDVVELSVKTKDEEDLELPLTDNYDETDDEF